MANLKRIAIQLFGHLRTFEYTFDSFRKNLLEENIQDGYQIDIFIHTWDELDHSTINYRNVDGNVLTQEMLTSEKLLLVNELYQPKKILIEPQLEYTDEVLVEKIGQFPRAKKGCLNNSYTIYMTNELRNQYETENNITYDWVIVTRPDIFFKKTFRIDSFLSCYSDFQLPIPQNTIFHGFNPFGRGNMIEDPHFLAGSDLVFFGSPDTISNASSLYTSFEDNIQSEDFYCMEVWWANFWRKKRINLNPINFKHGPDFDVIKTEFIEEKKLTQYSKFKYIKRVVFFYILNLFPYCLVKNKVYKLQKKIMKMEMFSKKSV